MKDTRWLYILFIVLFIIFVIWLVTSVEMPMKAPGHWSGKYGI